MITGNVFCGDGFCGSALVISVKLQERLWSWIYHFSIHYGRRCTSFETRNGDGFLYSLFNGSHSEFFAGTDVWPCTKRHGVVLHPPLALVEVNLCCHVVVQKAIVLETLWRQRAKSPYLKKSFHFLCAFKGADPSQWKHDWSKNMWRKLLINDQLRNATGTWKVSNIK